MDPARLAAVFAPRHFARFASNVARACLRFVVLTACRSGEARGATRDEIASRTWTHRNPLPAL